MVQPGERSIARILILIPHAMITAKSVAWGTREKESFKASQEAIRFAVQNHAQREVLRTWLENRTPLRIDVVFQLNRQRFQSDLDSLFSDLLNPVVEGACGPRAAGKPIPQTKDALFWKATLSKVKDEAEKVVIQIMPLGEKEIKFATPE